MPRPRSQKVVELKVKLISRIGDGFLRPGDRFMSNRALAERFGVSYQTAHRLIGELCAEGWLERRRASGTYIAGKKASIAGIQLLFHARARRPGSFGTHLLDQLRTRLDRERIGFTISFVHNRASIRRDLFPVIWECKEAVLPRLGPRGYALLLNDLAPPGLAGTFIDTIATDDFSGGVCAAEIIRSRGHARVSVLGGPKTDARSVHRVEGFCSLLPDAQVIWAGGWFHEDGAKAAPRLLKNDAAAVFCCNDRLAEGVVRFCQTRHCVTPKLIGFDDAPIAEVLNLTTIAIPWDELIEAALAIIRKRLRGDTSTAARQILAPRPVIR
ncbi:MAG: substrate-binding domain-containing protein [Methylacidiphilales bacterium]|nr:substrate-binding domain-containing protein [Candidatus Methylacidiphilales bacterium]